MDEMNKFSHESYTDQALRTGIRQLVDLDNYPWWRLAEMSGYSQSMLYAIVSGDRDWGDTNKLLVFMRLLSEDGNHRLHAKLTISPHYSLSSNDEDVKANGSLDDEVVDGTDSLVTARKAALGGDFEEVDHAIQEYEKVLHRLRAERKKMGG